MPKKRGVWWGLYLLHVYSRFEFRAPFCIDRQSSNNRVLVFGTSAMASFLKFFRCFKCVYLICWCCLWGGTNSCLCYALYNCKFQGVVGTSGIFIRGNRWLIPTDPVMRGSCGVLWWTSLPSTGKTAKHDTGVLAIPVCCSPLLSNSSPPCWLSWGGSSGFILESAVYRLGHI